MENNIYKLLNLPEPIVKPLPKKVLYCRACKCKTLKVKNLVYNIWECQREMHYVNESRIFESIKFKNETTALDEKYAKELENEKL